MSLRKERIGPATSLHHLNQHNKGPAVSMGTKASEEPVIAEKSAAIEEPRAMEETERVEIDDPPQLKVTSASLMILGERVEMQSGSPNIMCLPLKLLNVARLLS